MLEAAEAIFGYCPCMHCRRYQGDLRCDVYEDRIPDGIFRGLEECGEMIPDEDGVV